jgi:hypothetical protein
MGKLRCLAACLAIVLCTSPVAFAESGVATPAPFTRADIDQISDGFVTVGDYVAALAPTSYSWVYQGAATGETYLTLSTETESGEELGDATIAVSLDDELIDGMESGQRETLPEGLQDQEAWLVDAHWMSKDYPLPTIRGIAPGASQEDVVAAFFSLSREQPEYAAKDINPAVDDTWLINEYARIGGFSSESEDGGVDYTYGWCTLDAPDEWREYDQLVYHILGGVVRSIDLSYSSDPE